MPLDRPQIVNVIKNIYPFRKLPPAALEAVAGSLQQASFSQGEIIYKQGELASRLYLLFNGQVTFSVKVGDDEVLKTGTLEERDYFGFETLVKDQPYLRTVTAQTDSVLLYFDREHLRALLAKFPGLYEPLEMLLDSWHLMQTAPLEWLAPDENIYFITRRHEFFLWQKLFWPVLAALIIIPLALYLFFFLFPNMISLLIGAGILLLTVAGWGAWVYVDWANDYFIVTNRRVVAQERVLMLYDSQEEAPNEAIQNASFVVPDQWARWLKYGNIVVRTFTGTVDFDRIKFPQNVVAMVEMFQARAGEKKAQAAKKTLQDAVRKRIFIPPPPGPAPVPAPANLKPPTAPAGAQTTSTSKPGAVKKEVKPGRIQTALANFFRMRQEGNGIITYRTHWFILLQNIALPSLALFLLLVLFLLRLFQIFTFISLGLVTGIILLLALGAGVWWWYRYIDWSNDIYQITDEMLVDLYKKPLGREEKKTAPIKNIQSIEYERQGLIGLILNFGTVFIKIGESTFTFDNVYNPVTVQREIFRKFNEKIGKQKAMEGDQERQRIIDMLEAYHQVVEQSRKPAK
jgi:hypothetical protein